MSLHFGYDYKSTLIKKLYTRYAKKIETIAINNAKQKQLDDAEIMILNYFRSSKEDFDLLEKASEGRVVYSERKKNYIFRLRIDDNYIQFVRKPHAIEIQHGEISEKIGVRKLTVYGYIIPSEKRCVLKKIGKVHDGSHFDENVINTYVRKTFLAFIGDDE